MKTERLNTKYLQQPDSLNNLHLQYFPLRHNVCKDPQTSKAVQDASRYHCIFDQCEDISRTTVLTLVDKMKTFGCRLTLGTEFDENLVGGS